MYSTICNIFMKFNFLTKTAQKLFVLTGIVSIGALSISPAFADDHGDHKDMKDGMKMEMPVDEVSAETGNIVEVASTSKSFSTLAAAVEAAGLADTLADSSSSFTVFAPTDEAFSQLPEGALEYLLQPENQEVLQQVLSYHVLPEAVESSEISSGEIESLDGGLVTEVNDEGVTINNASVITPDIAASNGVIHGINQVLLPGDLQTTLASELGIDESELYQ